MRPFLIGASTAAHQVEGNNIYSDFWAMEQMENSDFIEPSLQAVDHYHHFKEDIDLLAEAGCNAFRFSLEWARIEPEKGIYNSQEIDHYREVLTYCHEKKIEPIVTMHHFSSPKWLIEQGGWEDERTITAFAKYCGYVAKELGDLMCYVCTINEANMGLQLAAIIQDMMDGSVQVGMNFDMPANLEEKKKELVSLFQTDEPNTFLSMRTIDGDMLIMRAHEAARKEMKKVCPHLQIGITLSLFDLQGDDEEKIKQEWHNDFAHYLPYVIEDDFFGLQNYTRKCIYREGNHPKNENVKLTKMGYENYPESIAHVVRKVAEELSLPILITENGIDTDDDQERVIFIEKVMEGLQKCVQDGIPLLGYLHWSLLDNFEWQKGYSETFGLIAVNRKTQVRYPKESLYVLGRYTKNKSL